MYKNLCALSILLFLFSQHSMAGADPDDDLLAFDDTQLEEELVAERKQRESVEKQLQGAETNRESISAELEMAKKRIERQKNTTAELKDTLEKSGLKLAWLQKDLDATTDEAARKQLENKTNSQHAYVASLQERLTSMESAIEK